MKNFTGKVTDVDNNGNPIKKKSSTIISLMRRWTPENCSQR